ncbi:MAG: signal peptidase II [Lachnospiraceae bacterium]|nr:signal peptidase II [Lachnospiraceae bacterium]
MIFLLLAILIILGEFLLKNRLESRFSFQTYRPILKGKIILRKYHNRGAFLNFLENKRKFLHMISIIFTLLITLLFLVTAFQKGNHWLKLGLSLLLGGAFSNTYDRLSRGYVVDYFSFHTPFKKFNQIVFNISDFCIILGCLILVICQKQ